MDLPDNTTQAFKNLSDGVEVQVVAHFHNETREYVVFWDDIQDAIPGVTSIRNGNIVVPRVILTVVVGELNPPNSDSARPRTPVPFAERESGMYEDAPPVHTHAFPNYAASVASSEATTNRGMHGASFKRPSHLRVEGEDESVLGDDDTESVTAHMETLDIRNFSRNNARPFSEGSTSASTASAAIAAAAAFHSSNNTDNFDNINSDNNIPINRSTTPPLSTSSSSESGTSSSGFSTTTTIPPISIETAAANGASTAAASSGESGATSPTTVPEPAEIDPIEATSSWASIFRTLGDLQEQFQLAPEDTVQMFTEITQST
ncbi:hypothetical protein BGZ95_010680 [Linnemannia exigua]|uniref:Uncharacterized protein n=1 Tax=Linnemannia exigua TaxID=604196 RepID=A0AAD4H5T8_9FUNG|nr:hypothetical protein BGZ95_010680 [Linnemannia exigua]